MFATMSQDQLRALFDTDDVGLCDGTDTDPCAFLTDNEHWGVCNACGYTMHDFPNPSSDNGHDALCCMTSGGCSFIGTQEICATHDTFPKES